MNKLFIGFSFFTILLLAGISFFSVSVIAAEDSVTETTFNRELSLFTEKDTALTERLQGRILLQVEESGEAWYVPPTEEEKYYLKDGETAFSMLRQFGLGVSNEDLAKVPVGIEARFSDDDSDNDGLPDKLEEGLKTDPNNPDSDNDGYNDGLEITNNFNPLGPGRIDYDNSLAERLKGRILLQVNDRGQAWYVNPADGKRYYMKNGEAAFEIMRYLSLGISNEDIRKISVGRLGKHPADSIYVRFESAGVDRDSYWIKNDDGSLEEWRYNEPDDAFKGMDIHIVFYPDGGFSDCSGENRIGYFYWTYDPEVYTDYTNDEGDIGDFIKTNTNYMVCFYDLNAGSSEPAPIDDDVININPISTDEHISGDLTSAEIVIVEFSDFDCPFCARFHTTMKDVLVEYGNQVAWTYRHFPLESIHPTARTKAEASECVADLGGNTAFWEFADILFDETRDSIAEADLSDIAQEIGVSKSEFQTCLDADQFSQDVEDDKQDAIANGGRGTPYSVILPRDGVQTPIHGALPFEQVKTIINSIIQ